MGVSPNATCPCGSGRKAKKCCLRLDGSLLCDPTNVLPVGPPTRFQNPKCYLRYTNNCSSEASREHYIPKAVHGVFGKSVFVSGMPWIEDREKELRPDALQAWILCKRHNNALSELDQKVAVRFFECFKFIDDLATPSITRAFAGVDVERMLLKMFLGVVCSGNLIVEGETLAQTRPPAYLQDILAGCKVFTPRSGLYVLDHGRGDVPFGFGLRGLRDKQTGQVYAAQFNIRGLPLVLLIEPGAIIDSKLKYRPCRLEFFRPKGRIAIELTWDDDLSHPSHSMDMVKVSD